MNARRALIVTTMALLAAPAARSGHEQPVYPSYYPHEIQIAAVEPQEAAALLRAGKLHAYAGAAPDFGGPDAIGTAQSLGAFLVVKVRPGSALVDVGVDQGGIAETSRPSSHSDPVYVEEGVVHYCVPNMPAACARTASLALEKAVLPYVKMLAEGSMDGDLKAGVQVKAGKVTHEHLARDTKRAYSRP